jgi:hypothetical protein
VTDASPAGSSAEPTWSARTTQIATGAQWVLLVAALGWAGLASVQFLTEAAARMDLAADIREELQAPHEEKTDELRQLQESIRSLVRSGSTVPEMTTRRIAHAKWCIARGTSAGSCPQYDGAVGSGRGGNGTRWDFIMDFSSNSLMAAAMMSTALVGALSGMFLRKRVDLWQIPLGVASGFVVWLAVWGLSGILTTVPGGSLNPFTSALISLGAGLSTEKVFRAVRDGLEKWTAKWSRDLETHDGGQSTKGPSAVPAAEDSASRTP